MPKTTKRSLAKKIAADPIMRELAENEAMYRKYAPKNKKEAKELLLCKLIQQMEQRLWRDLAEADRFKAQAREYDLEQEVFDRVLVSHPDQRENWKYNWARWFHAGEDDGLESAQDDIAYTAAWLKTARGMITTKRYHSMPKNLLEHMQFDGDGGVFWTDDMSLRSGYAGTTKDSDDVELEDIPF